MGTKRLFGALLICFTLTACHRQTQIDDEIDWLVRMSFGSDASLSQELQVSRTASGVEAQWQIATDTNKQDYLRALKKRIEAGYQVRQENASELVLSKSLPGDQYELRIAWPERSAQEQTFSFHFTARPD